MKNTVGMHISGSRKKGFYFPEFMAEEVRPVQLLLTPPLQFYYPKVRDFEKSIQFPCSPIVWHGPFITSVYSKARNYTRKYIQALADLNLTHKICIVMHCNRVPKDMSDEEAISNRREFFREVSEILKGSNVIVAWENSCCRRVNVSGYLELAKDLHDLGDPNQKLTLDTEHVLASGYDFKDDIYKDIFWENLIVLHLNPLPEYVKFGSGLDRHSTDKLRDSQYLDLIKKVSVECQRRGIPQILERTSSECFEDDFKFIKDWYDC